MGRVEVEPPIPARVIKLEEHDTITWVLCTNSANVVHNGGNTWEGELPILAAVESLGDECVDPPVLLGTVYSGPPLGGVGLWDFADWAVEQLEG